MTPSPRSPDLVDYLLNEAKVYGDLGVLAVMNQPTEENPRENVVSRVVINMEAELESPREM